jgi:DNA mismatch endonuclease (patch repair protein)
VDDLTPEQRKRCMSAIRGKDTKPELAVRRLVHSLGYRYRLHVRSLPGKPDLVFASRRKIIFVHGCFWHLHSRGCGARLPKSRLEYWKPKLEGNRKRDSQHLKALRAAGWDVLTIWECQAKSEWLFGVVNAFLESR